MKVWIAAIVIITLHACVLWQSVQHKSASVDELSHLATGLYSLKTGDFRMNRTAPPLQNIVCAIPVLFTHDVNLNYENESWRKGIWNGSGDRLLEANLNAFHQLLMTGRLGSIFLSCLLCFVVYLWSKELWGAIPALGVLLVTAFEPNLMAHGRLTTTDTAPALCFVLTGYTLWRFYHKPSGLFLLCTGICIGLACYAKHSGIVLLPAIFAYLIFLSYTYSQNKNSHLTIKPIKDLKREGEGSTKTEVKTNRFRQFFTKAMIPIKHMVLLSVTGLIVIWVGYGFEIGDSIHEQRNPNQSYIWSGIEVPLRTLIYMLGYDGAAVINSTDPSQPLWLFLRQYLPMFSHWEGYFANRAHLANGHLGYFMGDLSSYGWKSYYPVLFLIKTPTGLLALMALGGILLATQKVKLHNRAWITLIPIPLLYSFVIIFFNTANIGYRHALLVIPFLLILFAGASFRFIVDCIKQLSSKQREREEINAQSKLVCFSVVGMVCFCVILQLASVFSQYPHYLSYFNSIIGGPHYGHYYAVDSNLDWGQDILYIKDYIDENNIAEPRLLYFGPPTLLDAYDVQHSDARKLSAFDSGTYIISASVLHGIGAGKLLPRMSLFLSREPDDYITPAVFVYHIP